MRQPVDLESGSMIGQGLVSGHVLWLDESSLGKGELFLKVQRGALEGNKDI